MAEEQKELVWGIVEVMGHSSYGGVLEEIEQLGSKFLRVTVPENSRHNEYSIDLSAQSIFRMRRCNEAAARAHYSDVPGDCQKAREPIPATPLVEFSRMGPFAVDEPSDIDDEDERPF